MQKKFLRTSVLTLVIGLSLLTDINAMAADDEDPPRTVQLIAASRAQPLLEISECMIRLKMFRPGDTTAKYVRWKSFVQRNKHTRYCDGWTGAMGYETFEQLYGSCDKCQELLNDYEALHTTALTPTYQEIARMLGNDSFCTIYMNEFEIPSREGSKTSPDAYDKWFGGDDTDQDAWDD